VRIFASLFALLTAMLPAAAKGNASPRIFVATDLHYISPALTDHGAYFTNMVTSGDGKLVMYIDYYGLTPKRIYAMWLMALIAVIFVLIALGQFLRKLKTVALCFTVAVVMFAGLAVCNVNSLCAQYNADRYLSGTLETIDVDAMSELGVSAVPSLVRLATEMDQEKDPLLHRRVDSALREASVKLRQREDSVFSFSIPVARAKTALKNYLP